jgi:ABC-type sugar transport system permease subunit
VTEATGSAAPISDKRAATRGAGRGRRQGAGLDLILPYLLLAPSVLTVFGVLVYPLWNGLQASTKFYRYCKAVSDIGLDNYRRLWSDPEFLNALWVTVRFVTISVAIETVLGFALALFCVKEFAGVRLLRTILIVPMVITPVWRTFVDLTLPMMRPVLAVAIVLRTIDAFGTFDQVFVLTQGGPGTATKLISLYGYEVAFKFQQTGYAAALFVTVGLLILALALAAVRLLRRAEAA